MKYIFTIALTWAVVNLYGQSCCCAGAGTGYYLLPYFNNHFLGARAAYRNLYNELHSINPEINGRRYDHHLYIVELFGRFNLSPRVQLNVSLPYHNLHQVQRNSTHKKQGPGDITLLWTYQAIAPRQCKERVKHELRLGGGIKLPMGSFEMDQQNRFNTLLQLGTGSVDFPVIAIYTLRYAKFGYNTSLHYRFNTPNPKQFRFGDQVQWQQRLFYVIAIKELQLMPAVGLIYEYQMPARHRKRILRFTGGHYVHALAGIDIYYKGLAFSSSIAPALMNRLNWSGEARYRFTLEAGVFYYFKTKNH